MSEMVAAFLATPSPRLWAKGLVCDLRNWFSRRVLGRECGCRWTVRYGFVAHIDCARHWRQE